MPSFVSAMLAGMLDGRPADAPLFTGRDGGLLRGNNFRRRSFDRAATSVGLPGLTPHELRHTAASLAVSAGANVKAVQRMLGRRTGGKLTYDDGRTRWTVVSEAASEPLDLPLPSFDEIAASAAEYRRRIGQPELTDEEADLLALEESRAVRRARRGPFAAGKVALLVYPGRF